VTASDVLSLVLTSVFGIVSTVGVVYQVADFRRRTASAAVAVPPIVSRIRLLLLILTLLSIPAAALWVSVAVSESSQPLQDPVTWIAAIVLFLLLSVPLAVMPTVLSAFIGRGRAWARITAIFVLTTEGLSCGPFGFGFPIGVATGVQRGTTSTLLNVSLGLSVGLIGTVSLVVAFMLLLPRTGKYFVQGP
jgi:hypothetical protein